MIQEIAQNGQNLKYCIHAHCANWGKYNNFQHVLWGNFKILGQNIHPWYGYIEALEKVNTEYKRAYRLRDRAKIKDYEIETARLIMEQEKEKMDDLKKLQFQS